MESDKSIIGDKIRQARTKLGLTEEMLGNSIGLSQVIISKIESGQREVKAWELNRLAKRLYKGLDYFFDTKSASEDLEFLWRERPSNDSARIQVEERFAKLLRNFRILENLMVDDANKASLPSLIGGRFVQDFKQTEKLARNLGQLLETKSFPGSDLKYKLERQFGIRIFELSLGEEFTAASVSSQNVKAILINRNCPYYRNNFSIAHELFHLLTWDEIDRDTINSTTEEKPLPEKLADAFAAELLMPRDALMNAVHEKVKDGKLTYTGCINLADQFGVSIDALIWRLKFIGVIKEDVAKRVLQSDSDLRNASRKGRTPPGKQEWPISENYFRLAVECLLSGRLSFSAFAEFMEINQADIETLLDQYGFLQGDNDINVEIVAA